MIGDIITNLSEEELQHQLDSFEEICDECKVVHQACRIRTNCQECENNIFVQGLRKHFKKY